MHSNKILHFKTLLKMLFHNFYRCATQNTQSASQTSLQAELTKLALAEGELMRKQNKRQDRVAIKTVDWDLISNVHVFLHETYGDVLKKKVFEKETKTFLKELTSVSIA